MSYPHNPEFFRPGGRTASLKAGLPSYASNKWCSVPGHGNKRRPKDNKCCECLELKTAKAQAAEAALREMFRKAALKWARAEVVREQRQEVKRVAEEALKAGKAALKAQQKAERAKAKRAEAKAVRQAQKASETSLGAAPP